jgi:hypothetical protein
MTTLSNLFTPSTIICLGITLLLVGLLGMYFMGKFITQDHKISSMFGLVSSMAEEMHFMREKIQTVKFGGGPSPNTSFPFVQEKNEEVVARDLISVSDDDDDDDTSVSSSVSSESSSGSSVSSCSTSSVGSDDEVDIDEGDNKSPENIKIINIGETFATQESGEDVEELNESILSSRSSDDDDLDDGDDDVEISEIELSNSDELLINRDMLKTINISAVVSGINEDEEVKGVSGIDYKKMSVNQLRTVAAEKGLISQNSNKLKKDDLLKLLL